jgi:CTD kinase subunit gamma
VFDHTVLDELIAELQNRKTELSKLPSSSRIDFSSKDILRRIDEDRERHKRLRERAWILPAKSFANGLNSIRPGMPQNKASGGNLDALDVEFDYIWDNLSDLNEDDLERIREDDAAWWGSQQESKLPPDSKRSQEAHSLPNEKRQRTEHNGHSNTETVY